MNVVVAIAPSGAAMCLRTRYIQGRLFFVPLHGAPMLRASALCTQGTSTTGHKLVGTGRTADGDTGIAV